MKSTIQKSILSALVAGALVMSASAMASNPTPAPTPTPTPGQPANQFERGPNPTISSIEANRGPFAISTSRVASSVSGFGGGTIYYPTSATGTMAAIVVIPGYVSSQSSIAWWGPKLASHGFVVMTIDTNASTDQPPSRARQINAALDYLVRQNTTSGSAVRNKIDTNRLGVVGWSMGGGGTLRVASEGRIKAAIPLAPYDTTTFRNVKAPTLIFACESDSVAAVRNHASPFYNQLPSNIQKAYVSLRGGNHYCANGDTAFDDELSRFGVSWMKRFLDEDRRYSQFLCGPNHASDRDITEYRGNCPY